MRKLFIILGSLCVLLLLCACAPAAAAAEFSGGTGTQADPYLISTADDLWELADKVNTKETRKDYYEAHYKMTGNIDLGGRKQWIPIGNHIYHESDALFKGIFDGNGFTVSGIKISYKDPLFGNKRHVFGLFGQLEGTVKNLTVSNSSIQAAGDSSNSVGSIAAKLYNGSILNCSTTDTVTVSGAYETGGICANMNDDSVITGCRNAAAVTSTGTVGTAGGIVSFGSGKIADCINSGTVVAEQGEAAGIAVSAYSGITNCENTGNVTAEDDAAGIVCRFGDGALNHSMNDDTVTLQRCRNSGTVTSTKQLAGGIAVRCSTGTVADCFNSGKITAPKETGGIFAYFQISPFGAPCELFTVTGCENSGAVLSTENYSAGGICGNIYGSSTRLVFDSCVNSGSVDATGLKDVLVSSAVSGGIVGNGTVSDLEIRNCLNTGAIRGYATSGGILGKVSALSKAEETSLVLDGCLNSGKVYTVFSGGLTQETYAGGIMGEGPLEAIANEHMPMFTVFRIENCTNTGKLDGDRDHGVLRTDDLCASWKSELK